MTDDLLKRAGQALRQETANVDEGARFTRARVLASLQQSQVRSRARLAVLLPIAACFAAATAFGMVNGRTPAFVRSIGQALGISEATPSSVQAPKSTPARSASAPTPPVVAPPAPPEVAPSEVAPSEVAPPTPSNAAPVPEESPRGSSPSRVVPSPSARVRPSPSAAQAQPEPARQGAPLDDGTQRPANVSDRAHELYRVAHRTHFVAQDFVSALRAWDGYLEAAPSGRFVLEARYNRALCLVRLGRTGDARAALEPFASGKYSGYREAEARALIDALSK